MSGCGPNVLQAPAECTDGADCAVCEDGTDCNTEATTQASSDSQPPVSGANEGGVDGSTPAGTTVVIPAAFATDPDDPVSEPSTAVDPLLSSLPFFDPFAPTLLPLADIDILLSLFLDGLVLDLLTLADLNNELSFLELLCREGDTPEFRCRQLFSGE
jgi:hypothetical protein